MNTRRIAVIAIGVLLLAAPASATTKCNKAHPCAPPTLEQQFWDASQEGIPTHTETSTTTAIRCATKGCQ